MKVAIETAPEVGTKKRRGTIIQTMVPAYMTLGLGIVQCA